jgi:uncharacterized protein (UPF0332 family)
MTRNKNIYSNSKKISKDMAEKTINKAEDFVLKIRTFVQKNRTSKREKDEFT